jgi:hypothetical protein
MKLFVSIALIGMAALAGRADDFSSCFVPGEKVEYKVYWLGLPIAWSTITTDTITENERDLIRIRMIVNTYAAYKHIFEVDDTTEVIIDPVTALPVRHDWIINEGSIHKSHLTTFYHDKKVAVFQDRISKDIREIPIESDTQEVFSFIYANRNGDIEKLVSRKHTLLVTGKLHELGLKISDNDDIKLAHYGKVPSIEIEPIADFDGIFLRQGKVFFWISKQPNRVVTCIKAKVSVGKITAKIHKISAPMKGFWSQE